MESANDEIGNKQRMRIENPFTLKVGQVFTGFGIGCGLGIGVGRPINMGTPLFFFSPSQILSSSFYIFICWR